MTFSTSCVIHEGGYCPGCQVRYDWRFYGLEERPDDDEFEATFEMMRMEDEHEAKCIPYRDWRVMESLRFFARLDAVRAPGSW